MGSSGSWSAERVAAKRPPPAWAWACTSGSEYRPARASRPRRDFVDAYGQAAGRAFGSTRTALRFTARQRAALTRSLKTPCHDAGRRTALDRARAAPGAESRRAALPPGRIPDRVRDQSSHARRGGRAQAGGHRARAPPVGGARVDLPGARVRGLGHPREPRLSRHGVRREPVLSIRWDGRPQGRSSLQHARPRAARRSGALRGLVQVPGMGDPAPLPGGCRLFRGMRGSALASVEAAALRRMRAFARRSARWMGSRGPATSRSFRCGSWTRASITSTRA